MARKRRRTVKDIFTMADVGEMLLSFFAIITVLSGPTFVPEAFYGAGVWLILISAIIIYISMFTLIRMNRVSLQVDAFKEAMYHLLSAMFVTTIGVIIAGTLYDMLWGRTIEELMNSPLTVAYSFGLLWAGVIDGLKGDK